MKRVTRCLGCGRIVRLYRSFTINLDERTRNPLTGTAVREELIGQICRSCAEEAGYKVKEKGGEENDKKTK